MYNMLFRKLSQLHLYIVSLIKFPQYLNAMWHVLPIFLGWALLGLGCGLEEGCLLAVLLLARTGKESIFLELVLVLR